MSHSLSLCSFGIPFRATFSFIYYSVTRSLNKTPATFHDTQLIIIITILSLSLPCPHSLRLLPIILHMIHPSNKLTTQNKLCKRGISENRSCPCIGHMFSISCIISPSCWLLLQSASSTYRI